MPLKVVTVLVLALAFALLLWPPARAHLTSLLRTLLWAGCALTASSGMIVLGDAQGRPDAIVGGCLLLGFSAYAAATARTIGKR